MLNSLPSKERVFRTARKYPTAPFTCQSHINRPDKYKFWNENHMQQALNAVQRGWSIRRASEEYDVPRSTLVNRACGRVLPGVVSGPPKYLTTCEEEELVRFLLGCSSIGYAHSCKDVIALVQRTNESRGITNYVTNGWWESFCKRHPNLRASVPLSQARAKATDPMWI